MADLLVRAVLLLVVALRVRSTNMVYWLRGRGRALVELLGAGAAFSLGSDVVPCAEVPTGA